MSVTMRRLTVGASDDDVEVVTVLTVVDGCSSGHTRAPQGTLEVGDAGGVITASGRLDARVSLDVNVEGRAEVGRVTVLLTRDGVVRLKRGESEVGVCVHGSVKV